MGGVLSQPTNEHRDTVTGAMRRLTADLTLPGLIAGLIDFTVRLFSSPPRTETKVAESVVEATGKSAHELRDEARKELGLDSRIYNFAFPGDSGTGKSATINALRGVKFGQPGYAKEGITETTQQTMCYMDTKYKHIVYWDIPGGGTVSHQAATYFMDKKLYCFDAIIVVTSGRFTELDVAIARQALKFDVPLVFARNMADRAIECKQWEMPDSDIRGIKQAVHSECMAEMERNLGDEFAHAKKFLFSAWVLNGRRDAATYGMDEVALMGHVAQVANKRRNNDDGGDGAVDGAPAMQERVAQ